MSKIQFNELNQGSELEVLSNQATTEVVGGDSSSFGSNFIKNINISTTKTANISQGNVGIFEQVGIGNNGGNSAYVSGDNSLKLSM